MARQEEPLHHKKTPLRALADYLREGRRRKNLTYVQLASRAGAYSATTLQRAAAGQRLPRREVARAYAHVCGLDVERVDRLWEIAYREQQRSARGAPLPQALPPDLVHNRADLSSSLVALHARHGAPSIRLMHKRARQHPAECTPLSISTLHRILNRQSVPTSMAKIRPFLIGCDVPLLQRPLWEQAAERVRRRQQSEAARAKQATVAWETQFTEEEGERLSPERATQLLRAAGFEPIEPYHSFVTPWTVRCKSCWGVQRVILSAAVQERSSCPVCRRRLEESP